METFIAKIINISWKINIFTENVKKNPCTVQSTLVIPSSSSIFFFSCFLFISLIRPFFLRPFVVASFHSQVLKIISLSCKATLHKISVFFPFFLPFTPKFFHGGPVRASATLPPFLFSYLSIFCQDGGDEKGCKKSLDIFITTHLNPFLWIGISVTIVHWFVKGSYRSIVSRYRLP